jgi:hypothetical protein
LNNAWFYHRDLADGVTLELMLGPEPNFNWGVAKLPPSESPPALPVRVEPPEATLRLPANSIQVRASIKRRSEDLLPSPRLRGEGSGVSGLPKAKPHPGFNWIGPPP